MKRNKVTSAVYKNMSRTSQISSRGLIQLNTLEQSFEVAGPETLMVISLDDLEEDSWPILHRLREDLQEIAIVIIINQNLQFLQFCQVLFNLQSFKSIIFAVKLFKGILFTFTLEFARRFLSKS